MNAAEVLSALCYRMKYWNQLYFLYAPHADALPNTKARVRTRSRTGGYTLINLNLKQAREIVELFENDEEKIITVGFVACGHNGPELYVFHDLDNRNTNVVLERK